MRIYEGDFAYEIEPVLDRATQVSSGWRYNIYRVRPRNEIIRSGQADSKEAAEKAGQHALQEVLEAQAKGQGSQSEPAA